MKIGYILVLIISVFACKNSKTPKISMPKEEYRLLKNAPEDIESLIKAYHKSDVWIKIDIKTGIFKGKYKEIRYNGKYQITSTSAGISKGFNYTVELESLSNDITHSKTEEAFIASLAKCKNIYIGPDRLYNPQFFRMSIQNEGQISSFYLINGF